MRCAYTWKEVIRRDSISNAEIYHYDKYFLSGKAVFWSLPQSAERNGLFALIVGIEYTLPALSGCRERCSPALVQRVVLMARRVPSLPRKFIGLI